MSQRSGWWWAQALSLNVLALFAGGSIEQNICYWGGRAEQARLPVRMLAYAPERAPFHIAELIAVALWLAVWAVLIARRKQIKWPWFALAAPAVLLAFGAWRSQMSGSCLY